MRFGVIRCPTQVLFGRGMVDAAGDLVAELGSKVLICTDPQIAGTPGFAKLQDSLRRASGLTVGVFSDCLPDLPVSVIADALELAQPFAPDVIIGIGGGSSLDLAKVVSMLLSYPALLETYYGENLVPGPTLPTIAIPTTAGTGSEASPVAVVLDSARLLKVGVSSRYLVPKFAICDPQLSDSCPPEVTAYAGIDALAHAIEAYTAIRRPFDASNPLSPVFIGKNELSDQFALGAVTALHLNLVRAVEDGEDEEARDGMLYGSLLAGLAFGVAGTAAAHALQYPVGAVTQTPHGLGVGVLLPYVMQFNAPACGEAFANMAAAMNLTHSQGASTRTADAVVDEVAGLCHSIGIPHSLRQLGVSLGDLSALAEQALAVDRLVRNNPRPLDIAGITAILDAAWHGERRRSNRMAGL